MGGLLDVAQQVGLQPAQGRAPALGVGRDARVVGARVEGGAQQRAGLVEALGRERAAGRQRAQRVLQDAVGELAAGPGQQGAQPQQPDVAQHQTFVCRQLRRTVDRALGFGHVILGATVQQRLHQ